ncbi:MAG: hypothetical protein IJT27_09655 [Clostridia bacterium]|nr:hypothetical protein [Clostridia bacterium]
MKYNALPAYTGNRPVAWFSDGAGLADDITAAETADMSYIGIADDTDEAEFSSYVSVLETAGFACSWRRDAAAGLYRELTKDGTVVYLYYVPAERRTRIIADNASLPLADFAADCPASPPGGEILMQYGLYYDEMIKGYTCDCGMLYTVKLANGEFIVIDGGEKEQATNEACRDVMARLVEQAGKKDVTVALWLCTHPHDDHMDLFLKLMRVFGDTLHVKRVAFNFPAHANLPLAPYISRMKARLRQCAPEAKYLKLHTGQRFSLSGTAVDVLLTQEDALHVTGKERYSGTNETSAVVKICTQDFSLTLLADIPEENGDLLLARYREKELDCTFLQAAHHCINRIEEVYRHINARYVLIPEKTEMLKKHMAENYATICKYHPADAVLPAGDATSLFRCENGDLQIQRFPAPTGPYDGSEI